MSFPTHPIGGRRSRLCMACAAKSTYIKCGLWASQDRVHSCKGCGALVSHGEMVQKPMRAWRTGKRVRHVPAEE